MSRDPYLYARTLVLRNKLDIHKAIELDKVERRLTTERARQGVPTGDFDLAHLQAIHRHLFQDVYDWAGEIRTMNIMKDNHIFAHIDTIPREMAAIHGRLVDARFLKGLSLPEFAMQAGMIIGDVNRVHPFREGNGRTQMQYLSQLAAQAGHPVDLTKIGPEQWIEASKAAHRGYYAPMAEQIGQSAEWGALKQRADAMWAQTKASIERRHRTPADATAEIQEARVMHERRTELERKALATRQGRQFTPSREQDRERS